MKTFRSLEKTSLAWSSIRLTWLGTLIILFSIYIVLKKQYVLSRNKKPQRWNNPRNDSNYRKENSWNALQQSQFTWSNYLLIIHISNASFFFLSQKTLARRGTNSHPQPFILQPAGFYALFLFVHHFFLLYSGEI